ncbi:MAG: DNA-binding response regulator [Alkalicoccus sp.]|nr:MAG: DNA-binding response regulator [Alkalicoccus sp.]
MIMIRILLADDHQIIRDGLRIIFQTIDSMEIIDEAENGDELLEKALRMKPDLILSDLKMPGISIVDSTLKIKAASPETRIIVLTAYDDHGDIYRAMKNNIDGYIMKDTPPEQVMEAIRTVMNGEVYYQQDVKKQLEDALEAVRLTPREQEVFACMGEELSNQEIADRLHVSETTVKSHVSQILRKTSQPNRTQAVLYGVDHGLLNKDNVPK